MAWGTSPASPWSAGIWRSFVRSTVSSCSRLQTFRETLNKVRGRPSPTEASLDRYRPRATQPDRSRTPLTTSWHRTRPPGNRGETPRRVRQRGAKSLRAADRRIPGTFARSNSVAGINNACNGPRPDAHDSADDPVISASARTRPDPRELPRTAGKASKAATRNASPSARPHSHVAIFCKYNNVLQEYAAATDYGLSAVAVPQSEERRWATRASNHESRFPGIGVVGVSFPSRTPRRGCNGRRAEVHRDQTPVPIK